MPNAEFLMAFYGVDSPHKIPEMPEGAMIFVENITSVSTKVGLSIIEGHTIVMDAYKYCEYAFIGVGWSISSMPIDRVISQGYVYGLENITDYCGIFVGSSANMLSHFYGGAIASPDVYAEILGGMCYTPSIGGSITWYITGQSDWIYGRANMAVTTNPYQSSPLHPTLYA